MRTLLGGGEYSPPSCQIQTTFLLLSRCAASCVSSKLLLSRPESARRGSCPERHEAILLISTHRKKKLVALNTVSSRRLPGSPPSDAAMVCHTKMMRRLIVLYFYSF